MTEQNKLLLETLELVNQKLNLVIDFFNIRGEKRMTSRELEVWAKDAVAKHHSRKELKSSPGKGKVLPITGKGGRKDEREKSQG